MPCALPPWRSAGRWTVLLPPIRFQLGAFRNVAVTARERPKDLWESIASNLEVFNVKKLPTMLVPLAAMSKEEQADRRVGLLLQRAMKYIEGGGQIVPVIGARGASAVAKATYQLGTMEAKRFNLRWLGAMTAQVSDLEAPALTELAEELVRYSVPDKELWAALIAMVVKSEEVVGPAEIVSLTNALRRSMAFGTEPDLAFQALCRRTLECCQDFQARQCVGLLASVCRLNGYMESSEQYQVIHHLLHKWLAFQGPSWESTSSNQVISISVSLTVPNSQKDLRLETFLMQAARWAQHRLGQNELSAEDTVVLLWSFKLLTPVGLLRFPELVSTGLQQIRAETEGFKDFSVTRLCQALDVLLTSKHALAESSSIGNSEELLKSIETPLTVSLASRMAQSPENIVAKVLVIGEQGGADFWQRCSLLTEAVLQRAVKLSADEKASPTSLQTMLDTLTSSKIARASAFRGGCDALAAAVHGRKDASDPVLASVLQTLERATVAGRSSSAPEGSEEPRKSEGFDSELPLGPLELAERLGQLGKAKSKNATELSVVADRFMAAVDSLRKDQLLPALRHVLQATRQRINREPLLLEAVERLGDQVAMHVTELTNLQLISALDLFADLGLPYHLLFESVLVELLQRKQTLSWQQAIVLLEAFAVVRIRIPELHRIYQRQRRQQELARLPTMGMVRFLSAVSRLDLVDEAGVDVREMVCRILAETSPHRPLPVDDVVSIIASLLASGIVLPDMQLRHVLSWTASFRPGQLSERDLGTVRQYHFFLLAQVEGNSRFILQRMPVEMQTHISELLCHRAPAWTKPMTDMTRQLRAEVSEMLLAEDPMIPMASTTAPTVSLGPAGQADAEVDETVLLLDGPEAFFRPFAAPKDLRYTPQEKQRAWLMRRLLSSDDVRRSVADFYPEALDWPKKGGPRRINWLEWGQAGPSERRSLLGLEATGSAAVHSGIPRLQEAMAP